MDKVSPVLLSVARQRAARGVKWLDQKAKSDPRFVGWRLQLMHIHAGQVSSVVRMYWNTNDPLSLALKWQVDLACEFDGRVKWATVAPAFGFESPEGRLKALYLGLWEGLESMRGWPQAGTMEYCEALNQAWQEVLNEHWVMEAPRLDPWSRNNTSPAAPLTLRQIFRRWVRGDPAFQN